MPIRNVVHALLVGALLLPAARASAAAGRIGISATPQQVTLEPGATATIRITAPEPPVVSVNVGRLDGMKAVGPGAYQVTYVPPGETFPQVAIVVVATSHAHAWLPLPLAGTGEVVVKTEPNGIASLTIGETRFGPARADSSGRAVIPVVVPPGSKYAMSGGRRMALDTPDVSHLHLVVDRAAVAADATTPVVVRAFAVTPEGKPRRGAALSFKASAGQVSAPRELEPGMFEARWTVPPGAAGPITIVGSLRGEAASTSKGSITREAAAPHRLRIEVARESVSAGDGSLDFSLVVEDALGNPVEDAAPRASTNIGSFLGFTRGAPGRWSGRVAIPERIGGTTRLDIIASAGSVVAERSVAVMPGPAAEITIDPPATELVGRGSVGFEIATIDRFGNPTDGAAPRASARFGTVEEPARQGVGLYKVIYHPPERATGARDEITVQSGSLERISRVRFARERGALLELTPMGGVAARTGGGFGPVVGAQVALWGQLGTQELGATFNGSWFDFSPGARAALGPGDLSVLGEQTYISLTLSPSWRHSLGSRARVWASLGGGLTRVHSMTVITGQPQVDETKWVPTGTAAVSLGAKLWGGYPFIELRGSFVADPGFKNLNGSFWPFFLQAGYRFDAF